MMCTWPGVRCLKLGVKRLEHDVSMVATQVRMLHVCLPAKDSSLYKLYHQIVRHKGTLCFACVTGKQAGISTAHVKHHYVK